MKTQSTPALALTSVAAAALLLAGCFGGGGGSTDMPGGPTAAEVPESALASSTAYTQFTLSTAQSSSETTEPLSADKVGTPPSSETDEPVTVP